MTRFGVLITALLTTITCGGPRLVLQPEGRTIQAQCGVSRSLPISREQALCIAELAGLEKGYRHWGVIEEEQSWQVFNFTGRSSSPDMLWQGKAMRISKASGQITSVTEWEEIVVD